MKDLPSLFGSMVFGDEIMRQRLPKETYKALKKTMLNATHLELDVANVVANEMKDWAVERGATHYTHWFQPMTGITAEKHDGFIAPTGNGGIVLEFSGKELIRGEPDASSFPSGGIRNTFEARGYTAWDPSSYAFIKGKTLCIPTAFCSYSGEALDKKTPLLRSMQAVDKQIMRVLRIFGDNSTKFVTTTVGAEQEYFLIDKEVFEKRADLMYCGRTLFGAKPPKGQELDDHYFGSIKPRVREFMQELDEELWKLGVMAKTEHNEAAPGQHELAPIFSSTNIATDHNQLTMELMKSIASKHSLSCLLHEKPFAGVNGSGKHNNWSISTNDGENLFEPGANPSCNTRFLIFMSAVIKAVDLYQDLVRLSVATAGNDHRLGANEAPPAIVSIFVGDELLEVLNAIESGTHHNDKQKCQMEIGAEVLPHFQKDTTDRNRTSPFAFTGNKFEFRMPGSSLSISGPNIVINTIVADVLKEFADELEGSETLELSATAIIKRSILAHKRIVFNGNNYSLEWEEEAQRRGLSNLRDTVEALPHFIDDANIDLFVRHGVFTPTEIRSRYEILMENYSKSVSIEAQTMADMARRQILPSVFKYQSELIALAGGKKNLGLSKLSKVEEGLLELISDLTEELYERLGELEIAIEQARAYEETLENATHLRDHVLSRMQALRIVADKLETMIAKELWAFPTYSDIFFSVK